MEQFAVFRNANRRTSRTIPYLLNVQHDILNDLHTRVVVPLYAAAALGEETMARLTPSFKIEGKRVVMLTPQLAGISVRALGAKVADLAVHRDEILAALDFLWTAI